MCDRLENLFFTYKIIGHCVTKQTVQARITELHRIKQEPDEEEINWS